MEFSTRAVIKLNRATDHAATSRQLSRGLDPNDMATDAPFHVLRGSTNTAPNDSDLSGQVNVAAAPRTSPSWRSLSNERNSDEDTASRGVDQTIVTKRIACDICRERKVRCDRSQPCCGRCSRLGHRCKYTVSKRQDASNKLDVSQALSTLSARLGKSLDPLRVPYAFS